MNTSSMDALVTTEWLADELGAADLRILDGTYFLPNVPRDAAAEYAGEHIPGAVFFDIDAVKDPDIDLPHMLPKQELFSSMVRKMGIGDGDRIVVYDRLGMFSSPRVWWSFRAFGHESIAVLDGGLPKWLAEVRPVTDEVSTPGSGHFTARFNSDLVRDFDRIKANLDSGAERLVDGRPADRFDGNAPEPRAGLASGHIPNSVNLTPAQLMIPETGTFLSVAELTSVFTEAGLDPAQPMAMTCGSGIAASALSLARYLITGEIAPVYDGSWSEWGARDDAPVATGPA